MQPERHIEHLSTLERSSFPFAQGISGFLLRVDPRRLHVVSAMNPKWSETTKLPIGVHVEVYESPGGRLAAVHVGGSPSGTTFKRKTNATPGQGDAGSEYFVAVSAPGVEGTRRYLPPRGNPEIEPQARQWANLTFGDGDDAVHVHFDLVR